MSVQISRYVLLFLSVHLPTAFVLGFLLQSLGGHRNSAIGAALIYVSASVVGWRFVKLHQRHFSDSERRRLIFGCLTYLLSFEAFVLWANVGSLDPLPIGSWLAIGIFTAAFDSLALWLAFRFPVRRMMRKQLDRIPSQSPDKVETPSS